MLSNVSQYAPQGLPPQFSQGPHGYGAGMPFGQDFGAAAPGQYPFANGLPQPNPFMPQWQSPFAQSPLAGHGGAHNPAQHIVPALIQLAQQISVQNAVTQQIGAALAQLVQQLAMQHQPYPQGLPGISPFAQAGQSIGGTQPFGLGVPFPGGFGPQFGLTPQAQAWGANRPQTIQ